MDKSSISADSAPLDSTKNGSKIFGEKKNFQKFQKAKLEFAMWVNCLHSIYIILGIISNLEMIQSIWADVCT